MQTPPSPPARTDGSSVRIGALVPLTRPGWVEAGRHLLAGLELAVREVNDAGGIAGRPLELVVRDTAADPQRAAAAVDELARLGVAAAGGGVPQRRRSRRRRQGRRPRPAVPLLVSGARRAHRAADGMGRAPRPGAVPRLADLRGLPPRRGPPSHRRRRRAERLLGVRDPHPAGPPRSPRRHRRRARHARARPRGGVRRARRAIARRPSCSWSATRSRRCRSSSPSAATGASPRS